MSAMKKTMIVLLGASVVLGTVGASFAQNASGQNGQGKGENRRAQMFQTVDANSDGKLDFAEFSAKMNERFDAIDADKNGVVSADEIKAQIDTSKNAKRGERMAMRIAQRFDVDGNKEITKAELENRQQKMFAMMDMNDDGFIQADEMPNRKHHGGDRGDHGKRGEQMGKKRGWN